jgi:hypothetical protein
VEGNCFSELRARRRAAPTPRPRRNLNPGSKARSAARFRPRCRDEEQYRTPRTGLSTGRAESCLIRRALRRRRTSLPHRAAFSST